MSRLISCSACGRVHPKSFMCDVKKKRRQAISKRLLGREDNDFYSTTRWKKKRKEVLDDHINLCLWSYYIDGVIRDAECVHHIETVLENRYIAYNNDNLIPLSKEKHRLIHRIYDTGTSDEVNKVKEVMKLMLVEWMFNRRQLGSMKNSVNFDPKSD